MQNPHLTIWTENFTQNIAASTLSKGDHHGERFLHAKLLASVDALNRICSKIHSTDESSEFYTHLCVYIQEAKNCLYWYERSLDYELVNLNNSQLILSQGKSMIDILEATLRVIKYQ